MLQQAKAALKSIPGLRAVYHVVVRPFRTMETETHARRYCTLLPQVVAAPVFVKDGANDGVTGDPISDILLADERWRGLLIEPAPPCFQRLAANFHDPRRFVLEQAAVGRTNGDAPFYFVDPRAARELPGLPDWFDQLGSFDRNHILKHLDGVLEPFIIEQRVPVRRLEDVLQEDGFRDVHLLHIDVEGYDFEVLKTLDIAARPPAAILVEHTHLARADKIATLKMLRTLHYQVEGDVGNYFAVHRNSPLRKLVRDRAHVR